VAPDSDYASVWTEPFRVRAYEAGPDERASLLTVCNLFQEAAGEQARAHGLDVFALPAGLATWVLSRLHVVVFGPLPRLRDAVTVDTWPSDRDGLRAHRDFVLRDAAGTALVRATSVWFLLDVGRRRPVRLPPAMDHFLPPPSVPRALTLDGADPPAPPAEAQRTERYAVRHADLDRVGHANHVRVAEWALETVPEAARASSRLSGLDVVFQSETAVGDVVASACGADGGPGRFAHHLTREADGRTVAVARSVWT
jgi:acyl-ACP thioesterase